MELGIFLENVLRQYGASEYRTTLIRNGSFPPGEPKIDELTARAFGGLRVPVPHVREVVADVLWRADGNGV